VRQRHRASAEVVLRSERPRSSERPPGLGSRLDQPGWL